MKVFEGSHIFQAANLADDFLLNNFTWRLFEYSQVLKYT